METTDKDVNHKADRQMGKRFMREGQRYERQQRERKARRGLRDK